MPLLPINLALVIDGDKRGRSESVARLKALGVRQVDAVGDGWEAWQNIERQEYDVILYDWATTPGLAGFSLLSRIKCDARHMLKPLIAIAAEIPKKDFSILQEFPCVAFAEKPITGEAFGKIVSELRLQEDWYKTKQADVKKLVAAFSYGESQITSSFENLMLGAPAQQTLCLMTARILREQGAFAAAERILRRAMAQQPDSPLTQGELGKIQLKQGRFPDALKTLQKAMDASPNDIQRLCLQEAIKLDFSHIEKLRGTIKKALRLEAKDNNVEDLGFEGVRSMHDYLRRKTELEPFPHAYASLRNSLAIALVRNNRHELALMNYQTALVYAYNDRASAKVAFNIGLCYLRWKKPKEAQAWFEKAVALSAASLPKATKFAKRFQHMKEGAPIALAAMAKAATLQRDDVQADRSGKLIQLDDRSKSTSKSGSRTLDPLAVFDEFDFEDEKIA